MTAKKLITVRIIDSAIDTSHKKAVVMIAISIYLARESRKLL